MSTNLFKLLSQIIQESEISLHGGADEINRLTKSISEKIAAYVPDSLRILTFATLQMRDIEDHTKWAKNIFPNAEPHFFTDDEAVRVNYEEHIKQLKEALPNTGIPYKSSTVIGAMCEGMTGITMLEVRVVEDSVGVVVDERQARIHITKNELKNNYSETYAALLSRFDNNSQHVDFAVFVTMLSRLLAYWDVVAISVNNIKRKGVDNKSGIAGAILCFERGKYNYDDFIVNLPAFFSPILQLVSNAALLESTHHHHGHNKNNIDALKKLRPFIDTIKKMEHDILKAVGGCFGDDLNRFHADLCFVKDEAPDSLYTVFGIAEMTDQRKQSIGNSGIFHLHFNEYENCRQSFENWLLKIFPNKYPHLEANEDFKQLFVEKFSELNSKEAWQKKFPNNSSDNPFRKLLLGLGNRFIFLPHVDAMQSALNRDFPSECKLAYGEDKMCITLSVEGLAALPESGARNYLSLAFRENLFDANFARSRFHPQLWLKLYGGSVSIEWKNAASEKIAAVSMNSLDETPLLTWKSGEVATSFVARYGI